MVKTGFYARWMCASSYKNNSVLLSATAGIVVAKRDLGRAGEVMTGVRCFDVPDADTKNLVVSVGRNLSPKSHWPACTSTDGRFRLVCVILASLVSVTYT